MDFKEVVSKEITILQVNKKRDVLEIKGFTVIILDDEKLKKEIENYEKTNKI